jgi:hypothetical protein
MNKRKFYTTNYSTLKKLDRKLFKQYVHVDDTMRELFAETPVEVGTIDGERVFVSEFNESDEEFIQLRYQTDERSPFKDYIVYSKENYLLKK